MDMCESYKSCDQPVVQYIIILADMVFYGLGILYVKHFGQYVHGAFWMVDLIFFGVLIFALASTRSKCRFAADDTCVTFKRPLNPAVVIYYRDIQEITVYTTKKHIRRYKYGSDTFYVEVLMIKTFDREYEFRAKMDIFPDTRLEASGMMDKLLQMGKFNILKQFIEAKTFY